MNHKLRGPLKPIQTFPCLSVLSIVLIVMVNSHLCQATHEHICLIDDYTNDLPIFTEKRTICNYENVPILVYQIRISPDADSETKLCLKGELAESFNITPENEVKLFGRLEQVETILRLQIIKDADIVGTPGERRRAVNAIQFTLSIEDCNQENQISWQTKLVAALSSVCVALVACLAIMLILYQQKGLIGANKDEEKPDDMPSAGDFRNEAFINPRRTSSYELVTMMKHSETPNERNESR